jgi:hypothetical protein
MTLKINGIQVFLSNSNAVQKAQNTPPKAKNEPKTSNHLA